MPVELRKRKAPAAPPAPPPAKKASKASKTAEKAVKAVKETKEKAKAKVSEANGSSKSAPAAKGDTITLDGFGGEVETNDGNATTLKALVEESKAGVVIFTYPKASTPGCTKQACFFRDAYDDLTKAGLLVFGLSADSTKANTAFKTKQNLQYPLLCDPEATLIEAIGLKKQPKGTTRGVFVVDKSGKVLAAEAGGPQGTLDVVKEIVAGWGGVDEKEEPKKEEEKTEEAEGKDE